MLHVSLGFVVQKIYILEHHLKLVMQYGIGMMKKMEI